MPSQLVFPLTRLYISVIPAEPLDLSFTPLEKKVLKEFKDHISIRKISKNSQLSIPDIYKIINKKGIIKIKNSRKYSPDIKYRVQEARDLGMTMGKIAEIFNLERYRVIYIDRCNRAVLLKKLHFSPRKSPQSPGVS